MHMGESKCISGVIHKAPCAEQNPPHSHECDQMKRPQIINIISQTVSQCFLLRMAAEYYSLKE